MDSDELTVYILGYNSCAKTHSALAQYFSVVNFIPFFLGGGGQYKIAQLTVVVTKWAVKYVTGIHSNLTMLSTYV